LVLTSLGRVGSPLIRYRTGDLVRVDPNPPTAPDLPAGWRLLAGGVLGRADDMIHVRGNNLYPAAIEAIVRRFPAVAEFRVVVDQTGPLTDLVIEVEPLPHSPADLAGQVARAVGDELLFRAAVVAVPPGSLPRFELKARRVVTLNAEHKTRNEEPASPRAT
jgi:phenylacetate-CoA ligase